ncbi:ribosome maturation factor RimM [Nocardioides sp.]|uniref:ribosome maturation factor RimM n=1 Tax=Nocardioides sp. TaxID=35761 RepID=UPI003528434C
MESPGSSDREVIDVVVGRIGKPHGVRGEVTVDVRTDEPERRYADGAALAVEDPRGSAFPHPTLTVTRTRWHQGVLLATFAELTDRTAAEAARGVLLHAEIPADATPEDPEEFYDHQLVGLAAHDLDGTRLGEVTAVVHGAAQDLLTVRTVDGRDALVPFVAALVPEVDLAGGRVVIADRPGLVAPAAEDG